MEDIRKNGVSSVSEIYCYETKEKFYKVKEIIDKYSLSQGCSIYNVLNNPNKTAAGFHWCTDLSIFDNMELKYFTNSVYCYETKEFFRSHSLASKWANLKKSSSIAISLNDPNKTSGGYHWCTDLSIFDGIELKYPVQGVYCYETREWFKSCGDVAKSLGDITPNDVRYYLDKPYKTLGGYHWCTDLSVFDGVELRGSFKVIYCYETKERFDSLISATKRMGLKSSTSLANVVDNPFRTANGYHWCTDLSVFDGLELYTFGEFNSSSYEYEIIDFIKSLNVHNIVQSERSKLVGGKELDIFLPDYNLAIEFNGNYWHSEKYKEKNYHQDKTLESSRIGINLIHIFEFDWIRNKEIYKNLIKTKLGKLGSHLYARKCNIKLITQKDFSDFLKQYHLQGPVKTKVRLGLYRGKDLVSVMGFQPSRDNWCLNRFCVKNDFSICGAASKLLKFFERQYNPLSIVSYADLKHSNGHLYNVLGFTKQSINRPIYVHVKRSLVMSRYETSHRALKKNPDINYDPNLTEFENMDKNGFFRIWTLGTITFRKNY